jgi:acetyl-CoA C-acetyltransferase
MREVAILGIGQTPVEEHWEKSLRDLATQVVVNAIWDSQREKVDGILSAV